MKNHFSLTFVVLVLITLIAHLFAPGVVAWPSQHEMDVAPNPANDFPPLDDEDLDDGGYNVEEDDDDLDDDDEDSDYDDQLDDPYPWDDGFF